MNNRIFKRIFTLALACATAITVASSVACTTAEAASDAPTVWYIAHVQNIGWQNAVTSGMTAGTEGQSLRMEAFRVGVEGGVTYRAHVQNIGWQNWVTNDQVAGTEGKSLRMEAVQIKLTGDLANRYDIWYRAHVENIGWQDWVKNGQTAGTEGQSLRMEALQIKMTPKGQSPSSAFIDNPKVQAFMNDSRWKVGTAWGGNKHPILQNEGAGDGKGCNAYARDFTWYVYGKQMRSGTAYKNTSEIRAGDVIEVKNGTHVMIVLARNGDTIDVLHGNWPDKVCRSQFTISGNAIKMGSGTRELVQGYHY